MILVNKVLLNELGRELVGKSFKNAYRRQDGHYVFKAYDEEGNYYSCILTESEVNKMINENKGEI